MTYRANSKAWMRSDIFIEWLKYLDNYFRIKNKKVLLLIDNAELHFNSKRFEQNNDNETIDTNEDSEEEPVAESSRAAQNRKKSKKNKISNITLTNIELIYLPPNTTAHLQPMDAGIIHSLKAKYKITNISQLLMMTNASSFIDVIPNTSYFDAVHLDFSALTSF